MKPHLFIFTLALCTACTARDQIAIVPPFSGAVEHTVLFATNRAPNDSMFGETRSPTTYFGQATVAVPPEHKLGVVEYPSAQADPKSDFGIRHAQSSDKVAGFHKLLSAQIAQRPDGARTAIVYVHGFNNTFAEALYQSTQLMHDYQRPEIPILFSWPSSGSSLNYLHDHESTLMARTPLTTLLDTLERSDLDGFILVAHSMGSQLVMEALRQHAIQTGGSHWAKLMAVALVAPDIDVDVFAQQAKDMGGLPQPFLVVASENDHLLKVSGALNNSDKRLGRVDTQAAMPDADATLVSATFATELWSSNHFTAFRSPEMIAFLSAYQGNIPE